MPWHFHAESEFAENLPWRLGGKEAGSVARFYLFNVRLFRTDPNAGSVMVGFYLNKRRNNFLANIDRKGTTSVKPASRRWVDGRGHVSCQNYALSR
jgi:hypothetical protein